MFGHRAVLSAAMLLQFQVAATKTTATKFIEIVVIAGRLTSHAHTPCAPAVG